jgi:hypothetical protein
MAATKAVTAAARTFTRTFTRTAIVPALGAFSCVYDQVQFSGLLGCLLNALRDYGLLWFIPLAEV